MTDELEPIRAAAKGLLYPSDTDVPFDVVEHAALPSKAIASTLDVFFDELKDSDDAAKFAKLRTAIEATLSETKVYRFGPATKVDVWIVGKTKSGALAGLHTTSVET